jgi:hypothetical protein
MNQTRNIVAPLFFYFAIKQQKRIILFHLSNMWWGHFISESKIESFRSIKFTKRNPSTWLGAYAWKCWKALLYRKVETHIKGQCKCIMYKIVSRSSATGGAPAPSWMDPKLFTIDEMVARGERTHDCLFCSMGSHGVVFDGQCSAWYACRAPDS